MGKYDALFTNVILPKMFVVRQSFPSDHIGDISAAVQNEIISSGCLDQVKGRTVAVAVGSRGIKNLGIIVKVTVDQLQKSGASVFIVPAMGSQGGAVAENQSEMLAHLGIDEKSMGVPVKSTMDTVEIARTIDNEPVYFDAYAASADYTVSIVRIKPHTSFRGKYESGVVKMNVIGLGNQKGADACHHLGMHVMGQSLERFGQASIGASNLLFSVAAVENAYDETCIIKAIPRERVLEEEPSLLSLARERMPALPAENLDLLIVDEMGKNIAGTGVDSNIVQRFTSPHMQGRAIAKCISVLDLTRETDGAASGMGLVNFATRRFYQKIDFFRTYPNAITSRTPMAVRMPIIMENDYDAIRAGIVAAYGVDYANPRMIRIKNTMRLDRMLVSEALLPEIEANERAIVDYEPVPFAFDGDGNLLDMNSSAV